MNPYELELAEKMVSSARLRVETLSMVRKYIDDKLKSATLRLKAAEDELVNARQLRMF